MKNYVALARVSSREQEREGFSLQVQKDALEKYAANTGRQIKRMVCLAETASKTEERTAFKDLIAYTKKHAAELDGFLVYKLDRAARNLFDFVELERLESDYGVPFIAIFQPTDANPAGRMMRRTLANIASFYTEQMSVDIREGHARRVKEGWFVNRPPYGYRAVRHNGRSTVETEPAAAENVRRMFQLYAYQAITLDELLVRMAGESRVFRPSTPKFSRTKAHTVLRDRSYIGEVEYRGQWFPGKHEALVDHATWDRVQALLGGDVYHAHQMTFAGERITCAHCGHPITGERKLKRSASGIREYVYYRCGRYNVPGHPRDRVTEAEFDRQVMDLFARMRIDDDEVREWFRTVLIAQTADTQRDDAERRTELQRQQALLAAQQDKLLNLRLDDAIDDARFAAKSTELRDRAASIKLQLDVLDRSRDETAELAVKVFELSQALQNQWKTADYATKQRILDIVCLNCTLEGKTIKFLTRKPFNLLIEGLLVNENRGERI
jgi:site-specific DNA recombinase